MMKMFNEIKTFLEIVVIFLTFPEYAPVLAVAVVVGAAYSLLKDKNKDEDEDS